MSNEQVIQLLTEIKEILLRIEQKLSGTRYVSKTNEKLKRTIVNKLQRMGALKREYLIDTLKKSYSIQEIESTIEDLKRSGMLKEENGLLILLEQKQERPTSVEDERVKQIKSALSK